MLLVVPVTLDHRSWNVPAFAPFDMAKSIMMEANGSPAVKDSAVLKALANCIATWFAAASIVTAPE